MHGIWVEELEVQMDPVSFSKSALDAPGKAEELLARIRERRPLIHHLANFVTIRDVAVTTRVMGALPVMAIAPEEVGEIVARADALVVSLGTPTRHRLEAILLAVRVARDRGLPIVFDPVGVGASRFRTESAAQIVEIAGRIIVRANPAEAAALVGKPAALKGVEAVGPDGDVFSVASALARRVGIAAVTGPRDVITDGTQTIAVDNGHPWLRAVVGAGCMATAVVGAFCAVADPAEWVLAGAAALAYFGLSAERAARQARGPGTLVPILLDELFALTPEELRLGMRATDVLTAHAPS